MCDPFSGHSMCLGRVVSDLLNRVLKEEEFETPEGLLLLRFLNSPVYQNQLGQRFKMQFSAAAPCPAWFNRVGWTGPRKLHVKKSSILPPPLPPSV